jgi:hypothetical protein
MFLYSFSNQNGALIIQAIGDLIFSGLSALG